MAIAQVATKVGLGLILFHCPARHSYRIRFYCQRHDGDNDYSPGELAVENLFPDPKYLNAAGYLCYTSSTCGGFFSRSPG